MLRLQLGLIRRINHRLMLDHDVRFVDPTRINRRFEGISQRVEAGVLCDSGRWGF